MSDVKLWDAKHSYRCNGGNYFAGPRDGGPFRKDSWAEFAETFGDSDPDYNFVVRWDWHRASPDDERPGDELHVHFLGQLKGLYWTTIVRVTEADEPAARAWLATRWEYMRALWAPLADVTP